MVHSHLFKHRIPSRLRTNFFLDPKSQKGQICEKYWRYDFNYCYIQYVYGDYTVNPAAMYGRFQMLPKGTFAILLNLEHLAGCGLKHLPQTPVTQSSCDSGVLDYIRVCCLCDHCVHLQTPQVRHGPFPGPVPWQQAWKRTGAPVSRPSSPMLQVTTAPCSASPRETSLPC